MEKIGTKIIEVDSWRKLEFDVYPCNCKVGDTVWFDDGLPDEDGTITDHSYKHGKVVEIEPDKWWEYDDGETELGCVTVEVEDDEFYAGQKFSVAFKNIIYQPPTDLKIGKETDRLKTRLSKLVEMFDDKDDDELVPISARAIENFEELILDCDDETLFEGWNLFSNNKGALCLEYKEPSITSSINIGETHITYFIEGNGDGTSIQGQEPFSPEAVSLVMDKVRSMFFRNDDEDKKV